VSGHHHQEIYGLDTVWTPPPGNKWAEHRVHTLIKENRDNIERALPQGNIYTIKLSIEQILGICKRVIKNNTWIMLLFKLFVRNSKSKLYFM
jgi:hypothetical protein